MPKSVKGFLTSDQTFFATIEEAERYEAHKVLYDRIEARSIAPDPILELISELSNEIARYLKATTSIPRERADPSSRTEPGTTEADTTDDGDGKEDTESVHEQPSGRGKSVPHLRSRKQPA